MLPSMRNTILSGVILGLSLSLAAPAALADHHGGKAAATALASSVKVPEGMPAIDPKDPLYQVDVDQGVSLEDVRQGLELASQERNMNIVNKLDIQEGMKGRGFEAKDPYMIYEVCNLGLGAEIIKGAPEFGAFAPCKIILYGNNGKYKLLTYRPTYALTHLKNFPQETRKIAERIESDMLYIMSKAKEGSF